MQHARIAVVGGLTVIALVVDAFAMLAMIGEDGLGGVGLMGVGFGSMLTMAAALALADRLVRQWGSPDGSGRRDLIVIGLVVVVWCLARIGLGDVFAIPATVAITWLIIEAAMFVEPSVDDEEDEEPA